MPASSLRESIQKYRRIICTPLAQKKKFESRVTGRFRNSKEIADPKCREDRSLLSSRCVTSQKRAAKDTKKTAVRGVYFSDSTVTTTN